MNLKLNWSQWKGLAVMVLSGIATYLLPQDSLFQTLAGALMGVGLAILLKFIPFKWSELNFKRRSAN